ncbi:SWI/SNF and RSC complexes subunit ssr4, partial [Neolecta irregularis DAH-3]
SNSNICCSWRNKITRLYQATGQKSKPTNKSSSIHNLTMMPLQHTMMDLWAKSTAAWPIYNNLSLDTIADMLQKAPQLCQQHPFVWSYIDKPTDGQLFLVFIPPQMVATPPGDGFQYMDPEKRMVFELGNRAIEVFEHKCGFIPGQEQFTSRVRRRFHLVRGGNEQLWFLYYLRSEQHERVPVNPALAIPQPARRYPLPPISQKELWLFGPPQTQSTGQWQVRPPPTQATTPTHHMGMLPASVMQGLPSQGSHLATASVNVQQPQIAQKRQKTEQDDDLEFMSVRDIAKTRYMRHHDWMEEVLGSIYSTKDITPSKLEFGGLTTEQYEDKIVRLITSAYSNQNVQKSIEDDCKKMEAEHAEKLEKFQNNSSVWKLAERELEQCKTLEEIEAVEQRTTEKTKTRAVSRPRVRKVPVPAV